MNGGIIGERLFSPTNQLRLASVFRQPGSSIKILLRAPLPEQVTSLGGIMSFTSNVFRIPLSIILVLCFAFVGVADTIRLKDGSKVKGKIVSFSGGKFVIAVGDGSRRREMTLLASDVESIEFDTPRSPSTTVLASDRTSQPVVSDTRKTPPINTSRTTSQPVSRPAEQVQDEEEVVVEDAPAEKVASVPASSSIPKKVSYGKPVALSVKVLADNTANGWTNSGWVVKKGQRIRISGTGQVSIGRGKTTGPSGLYDVEDGEKLLKSVPTGALIAVIGDDNNDFIYIGGEREFTASRDGALFLGLNEGNLNDNSGSFEVKIEITPDGAE